MKFSIIVPVYNTEKYLKECIDSLLNQTHRDFEIILVDDGSTDSSGEICESYASKYPEKIRAVHQQNGRQLRARLNGISLASGEYCVFCDSDDTVSSSLLKTLDEKSEEYGEPDMIIYSFRYFDDNGRFSDRKKTVCSNDKIFDGDGKKEIYAHLISDSLISSMNVKAVKTAVLQSDKDSNNDDMFNLSVSEDLYESLSIVTLSRRILYINEPMYYYRYNPSSVSRSVSAENIGRNNAVRVYYELKRYLGIWGMDCDEWNMRLNANWLSQTVYNFCRFYLGSRSVMERRAVINYDWQTFVSPESLKDMHNNRYLSPSYAELWRYILNKNKLGISLYFFKKKIYDRLKMIKRLLKRKDGVQYG